MSEDTNPAPQPVSRGIEDAAIRAFERAQEVKRAGGEIRIGYSWERLSEETKSCWRSIAKAAIQPLLNNENLRELRKNLREPDDEPTIYVSRKSLDALLKNDGSHVALQTIIHRQPLKSGNGVALYLHPPADRLGVKPLIWEDCGEDMGWCADTIVGRYWVEPVHIAFQARFVGMRFETEHQEKVLTGVGFETAKDAAFKDYQRRILSALSTPATEGSKP